MSEDVKKICRGTCHSLQKEHILEVYKPEAAAM